MVQPYNYLMGGGGPIEAALGGLRIGASLAEMEEARAARVAKEQAALEAAKQERLLNEERAQLISGPLTRENMFRLAQIGASKEQREMAQSAVNQMTQEQQRASASRYGQLVSAAIVGNQPVFNEILNNSIQAETNPASRQALQTIQKLASTMGPDAGQKLAKVALAEMLNAGGEYRAAGEQLIKIHGLEFGAAEKLRRETAEANIAVARAKYADVLASNEVAKAAAEARRLGVEADKLVVDIAEAKRRLESGPDLESDARKLVNDSITASMASRSLASQYESLANNISTEMASGIAARGAEAVKRFFGAEDQITRLRQEYRRLRNSQVIQNLPPGAASDRDIQVALEAFPPETADPSLIASFLRGTAKLQRYDAALASAKAEWTAQNGSLGRSRRAITVMGKTIPAGANFDQTIGDLLPNVDVLNVPEAGAIGARGSTAPLQGPAQTTGATATAVTGGNVPPAAITRRVETIPPVGPEPAMQRLPSANTTTTTTRASPVRVTVNGRTFEFPTQEAADKFRAAAGVR